jgi:hypothetical protein
VEQNIFICVFLIKECTDDRIFLEIIIWSSTDMRNTCKYTQEMRVTENRTVRCHHPNHVGFYVAVWHLEHQ